MYIVNVSLLRRKQLEVEQLSSCFYEVLGSPTNLRKYCYFFTSQSWKMRSHLLPYSKAIWTHVVCCLKKIKRSVLNKGGLLGMWVSFYRYYRPMKHWKNCPQNWIISKNNLAGSFYLVFWSINNIVNQWFISHLYKKKFSNWSFGPQRKIDRVGYKEWVM